MALLVHFVTAIIFFFLWRGFSQSNWRKYVIKGNQFTVFSYLKLTLLLLIIPYTIALFISLALGLSLPGGRWPFVAVLIHLLNLWISRNRTKAQLNRQPG